MRYLPLIVFTTLCLFIAGVLLTRGDAPNTLPSPLIGHTLPEFTLPNIEGEAVNITELAKGKITIINMFASWCVPCLMEHPQWMRIIETRKVQLIGISWKDRPEKLKAWLLEHGNPYTHVLIDTAGKATTTLGITGVPETYIIDNKGIIRHKISMPLTDTIVQDELLPILEQLESE